MTAKLLQLILMVTALALVTSGCIASDATNLRAEHRAGQVFIQWDEPEGLSDVYFSVLMSREPITDDNVADATVAGHHIMPGESTDWWLNPETYGKPLSGMPEDKRPEVVVAGWILEEGGERIAPGNGLFVHTVTPETEGEWYYAVMATEMPDEDGFAAQSIIEPGANSLTEPVTQTVAEPQPIWQGDPAAKPQPGAGDGLPLDVPLHAKTGRGGMNWLMFGDNSLGWRDGLPFKFGSRVAANSIQASTTDRHWIARILENAMDGCNKLTPAIHSFWWGYNDKIYDPELMADGVCRGYGEYRVLWMVKWAQEYFGTDPNRTYAAGGSMGGCASFNIAFRHPEIFAAIAPTVGIVEYRRGEGGDSVRRIDRYMGELDAPSDQGMTIGDRLNATLFAAGRHGCTMAWNDGEHGSTQKLAAADFLERRGWGWLHRFALNLSYPALSNCSLDDEPGNGDKEDGDIEGYMNRGLDWDDPTDAADAWEVTLRYTLDAAALPLAVDVTPRRVQSFVLQPGEKVTAASTCLGSGQQMETKTLEADENGRVTFEGLQINTAAGASLRLTRAAQ